MITKIFASGNSQALRIPKEYRTDEKEVNIEKIGDVYVISPADDPWAAFKASLGMFTDDFMAGGRNQPPLPESGAASFD
ncbi:antitoxin [uncultured Selenomonas sp.]|jgi:antitoxin VapB|uniref:antitoxin n=1 Tax=uncultured Selenomonas sp. TaxID=159275 RepID=UPI0025FBE28F|nr:type II toxin-antitoxin system VapB family antitoxin [uncultured Selenomonas sp.]